MRKPFVALALSCLLMTAAHAKGPMDVNIQSQGTHKDLLDRRLYEINLNCQARADLPSSAFAFDQQMWNTLVHFNAAANNFVIISSELPATDTSNPGKIVLPTKGIGIFPIFSVKADSAVDYRTACTGSVYVVGGQKIYLTATSSWSTQNTPGPLLSALYQATKLISPLWSIFAPFPANIAGQVTNTQATENVVKDTLTTLNQDENYGGVKLLGTGKYVVSTTYSRVIINVTEVTSLVKSKSTTILADFRKQLDAAPDKIDTQSIRETCDRNERQLLASGFSIEEDVPYGIAYLGAKSFSAKEDMLKCLGPQYALRAAALGPILWDRISELLRVAEIGRERLLSAGSRERCADTARFLNDCGRVFRPCARTKPGRPKRRAGLGWAC